MSILVFLWYMHSILMASVSVRGSLFSSGGIVGSMYVMVSSAKCMLTCVSLNLFCTVCHLWSILCQGWGG
jgi:hypothetical protein